MSSLLDEVQVCADDHGATHPMGALRRQRGRNTDLFSFEYDSDWLTHPEALTFDPDLALVRGRQYPPAERASFGIFLDSSPDRWGRVLMQRRENALARREGRPPRTLREWDFLLGVHDETRLGALRFRASAADPFLDRDASFSVPPIASLRALQAASLQFETDADETTEEAERWIAQLYAPGSSLGGARPKASVRDERGALCIAKFPSRQDRRDVGAWELVAHRLAIKAGIDVPTARAVRVGESRYSTFVARRFDRTSDHRRRAFVSAMTLTQRTDGEPGASYLELVDLLQSRGRKTHTDCVELFRRVVFGISIHNVDDHLRNHGFFLHADGIELAPAYDVNPSPEGHELSLAIDEIDATCDVRLALATSRSYGLSRVEADKVIAQVQLAVGSWRAEATELGIPRSEREEMASAFEPASSRA